ncbi:hypothetical protein FRB95_001500, partial [Tulasnella sp. JGI-2019a]
MERQDMESEKDDGDGGEDAWIDIKNAVNGELYTSQVYHRHQTKRTLSDQIAQQEAVWLSQMEMLVDCYLEWKHTTEDRDNEGTTRKNTANELQDGFFTVDAMLIHWHDLALQILYNSGDIYCNATLLWHGFLSSSPTIPSIAISLHTLETHCLYHLQQPSISIQTLTKVL